MTTLKTSSIAEFRNSSLGKQKLEAFLSDVYVIKKKKHESAKGKSNNNRKLAFVPKTASAETYGSIYAFNSQTSKAFI